MKSIFSDRTSRSKLKIVGIIAAVTLIATNSTVNVLTVQAQVMTQNNEIQKIVSNIDKEAKRRTESTTQAKQAIQSTETISGDTKSQLTKSLDEVQTATDTVTTQAKSVKDVAGAQQLAKTFDQQYDKYATTQAKSTLLKDGDQQMQTQQQLMSTAQDLKSKLSSSSSDSSSGSSSGSSSSSLQLEDIITLITAIAAIVTSVIALITAIANGDYTQAATLFTAIIGQLATNLATILNVQSTLQVLVGSTS